MRADAIMDSIKERIAVEKNDEGLRLDMFVSEKISGISRSRAGALILNGDVTVSGEIKKPAFKVKDGDVVEVLIPPPKSSEGFAQDIPLDVIYEDDDVIVVNKPAGMVVHPAAGHRDGTLVNALLAHCKNLSGIGGKIRAGIVHRLDVGTSGTIVAAKNDAAHNSLSNQFKSRKVKKIYLALVYGSMQGDKGFFDSPIGRSQRDRKKFSSRSRIGRQALTEWRVVERFYKHLTLVEVTLHTGRTHQIRVHFAEGSHPLVGDPVYGGEKKIKRLTKSQLMEAVASFSRPALHAWKLGFYHPKSGEFMEFESEIAKDFASMLCSLRNLCSGGR
ncbi:MAG: Ribosomal large subunit pseudouridine synthase D [bacterium ADurb.Bin270]|nr:MAG: Ribosomal large subunit pseudouridine synthase D [bacterium ADurb.Bin270]